jgi:glutathione S-transferase
VSTAPDEVVVYTSATCGWALRVYAVLVEKGAPFRLIDVKSAGRADQAAWRAASPYGRTPAIRHGDVAVWESWAIGAYLDQAFPTPALGARDAMEQALADLWMWHADREIFPLIQTAARLRSDDSARLAALEAVEQSLAQLDHPAFDHRRIDPFWSGDRLGLVDIGYQVLFDTLRRAPDWAGRTLKTPGWFDDWAAIVGAHPTIVRAGDLAFGLRRAA